MKSVSIVKLSDNSQKKNSVVFGAVDEKENIIGTIELENEEGFIDISNIL